jgi:hypothetical protein
VCAVVARLVVVAVSDIAVREGDQTKKDENADSDHAKEHRRKWELNVYFFG